MRNISSLAVLFVVTALAVAAVTTPDSFETKTTAVTALSLGMIVLSLVAERLRPFRRSWNQNRGDLTGDIGSLVGIFGVLDGALKLLGPVLAIAVFGDLATSQVGLSLPVEVIVVTLVIELGSWVTHWLHHTQPNLWKLHAMHHSTERLYTLNNFRFHPLNHILNAVSVVFVPLLLGFSEESILIYTAITTPVLVLQHSNIDFEFGWLNRLVNTNEVHRWHHSTEPEHRKVNLGRALTIWDQLFGTYVAPTPAGAPTDIGLMDYSKKRVPPAERTIAQLIYPFKGDTTSGVESR